MWTNLPPTIPPSSSSSSSTYSPAANTTPPTHARGVLGAGSSSSHLHSTVTLPSSSLLHHSISASSHTYNYSLSSHASHHYHNTDILVPTPHRASSRASSCGTILSHSTASSPRNHSPALEIQESGGGGGNTATSLTELVRRLSWEEDTTSTTTANSTTILPQASSAQRQHSDMSDAEPATRVRSDVTSNGAPLILPLPYDSFGTSHHAVEGHTRQTSTTMMSDFSGFDSFSTTHTAISPILSPKVAGSGASPSSASLANHRKVASCPYQLNQALHDLRPEPLSVASSSALTSASTSTVVSPSGSPRERGSPRKLVHTPSTHSALFHPYAGAKESSAAAGMSGVGASLIHMRARDSSNNSERDSLLASLSSSHRPTVISPASKFLSRTANTLPAALSHAMAHSNPNSTHSHSRHLNGTVSVPSHSPSSSSSMLPHLSLSTMSSQPEYTNGTMMHSPTNATMGTGGPAFTYQAPHHPLLHPSHNQQHGIMHIPSNPLPFPSPSLSPPLPGSSSVSMDFATPPHSPNMHQVRERGVVIGGSGNTSSTSTLSSFRTPTHSPLSRPYNNLHHVNSLPMMERSYPIPNHAAHGHNINGSLGLSGSISSGSSSSHSRAPSLGYSSLTDSIAISSSASSASGSHPGSGPSILVSLPRTTNTSVASSPCPSPRHASFMMNMNLAGQGINGGGGGGGLHASHQHHHSHHHQPQHPHSQPHHHHSSSATSVGGVPINCHSPIIRPDFSAFDSSLPGSSVVGWNRLSAHSSSPAKHHRSLPGTPLHGARGGYSVPPTPNAKRSQQQHGGSNRGSRSRRNSHQQQLLDAKMTLLETAALLIDYSSLHTPLDHIPLMSALPKEPSWYEMILEQNELGQGSYGCVYRVAIMKKDPFSLVQNMMHQQRDTHSSGGLNRVVSSTASTVSSPLHGPLSAPTSPRSHADSATTVSTITSSTSLALSQHSVHTQQHNPPVHNLSHLGVPTYAYAYKRALAGFASAHERMRMLRRYMHLYEFVQGVKMSVTAMNPSPTPIPVPSSPAFQPITLDSALLAYIDPQTYFPRHLVHHYSVWQEHTKLHCLMELCERGDLTTYWNEFTEQEVRELKKQSSDNAIVVGSGSEKEDAGMTDTDAIVGFGDAIPPPTSHTPEPESSTQNPNLDAANLPRSPLSPIGETIIWRLLLELSSCLSIMHAFSYYHLDIKPGNIFITENESFKLGDMDSSVMIQQERVRARSSAVSGAAPPNPVQQQPPQQQSALTAVLSTMNTASSSSVGASSSPPAAATSAFTNSADLDSLDEGDGLWCAPELLQSMQNITAACDIYSLGASVYSVLNDELLTMNEITGERHLTFYHLRCPISSELHSTLLQMTHRQPQQRPCAIEIMQRAKKMIESPVEGSQKRLHWTQA